MPLSPAELARRRIVNQATHRAARKAAARTQMQRAAAAWDHWRAVLGALPDGQADPWAEAITSVLETQIAQLTQTHDRKEGGRT